MRKIIINLIFITLMTDNCCLGMDLELTDIIKDAREAAQLTSDKADKSADTCYTVQKLSEINKHDLAEKKTRIPAEQNGCGKINQSTPKISYDLE